MRIELGCQPTCLVHPPTYLNKVLVGGADGSLHLWNVVSRTRLFVFRGWGSPVAALEAAPALDVVAVGLADGAVVLLNVRVNEVLMRFSNAGGAGTDDESVGGPCSCLAFRCALALQTLHVHHLWPHTQRAHAAAARAPGHRCSRPREQRESSPSGT